MKKIFKSIIMAAALAVVASCDFLERAPYTQLTPENFFQNETQFKQALVGAYQAMYAKEIAGVSVSGGSFDCGLLALLSSPSDEVFSTANANDSYGAFTDLPKATYTQATGTIRRFWTCFYGGIDRCNSVICHIDNINGSEHRDQIFAEARFLRGFYYFHLAQNFGGVPIVVYQSAGLEPRASLEELYSYILDDMQYAYENLPATGGMLAAGSANKYTAAAYIAKICNYLAACKRYEVGKEFLAEQPLNSFEFVDEAAMSKRARACCEDIIANSSYKLTKDFTNLFRETTKEEQHEECLFCAEHYIDGSENKFPTTQVFGFCASCTWDETKQNGPSAWSGYITPNCRIFSMYSPKDPRRDWFFTSNLGAGSLSNGDIIDEKRGNYIYPRTTYLPSNAFKNGVKIDNLDSDNQTFAPFCNGQTCNCVGKYRFIRPHQIESHGTASHSLSYPLMRLAEVYLMYAEAIHFDSDGAEDALAREQFIPVLQRACRVKWAVKNPEFEYYDDTDSEFTSLVDELMGAYHKEDFIEELLETRERELCFEGSRKYDLIRFNKLNAEIDRICNGEIEEGKSYDAYFKRFDGKVIACNSSYIKNGIGFIRDAWKPFKMWLPISELEIAANPNITQNAQW